MAVDLEEPFDEEADELAKDDPDRAGRPLLGPRSASSHGDETSLHRRRRSQRTAEDSDSDGSSKSRRKTADTEQWSTQPDTKEEGAVKPKRRVGLCRGKPPPEDSESDSSGKRPGQDQPDQIDAFKSSEQGSNQPPGKEDRRQSKSGRRSGLCRGKRPPDDSDSDSSGKAERSGLQASRSTPKRRGLCRGPAPAGDSEAEDLRPQPKPKPKPKPRAKRQGRALCGAGGRKKGIPALDYDQWRRWLASSELLPPGFAGLAADTSPGGVAPASDDGAGSNRSDPSSPSPPRATRPSRKPSGLDDSDSSEDYQPARSQPRR